MEYVINYFKYYVDTNITLDIIKKDYFSLFTSYKKLIIKFINMIKSNGHGINNFKRYIIRNKYIFSRKKRFKNICFLIIMFDIYRIYLEELNSSYQVDFDSMIDLATKVV